MEAEFTETGEEVRVVVFFGRGEVHLRSWRGLLRARYGGGLLERSGPFQARRSAWFRVCSGLEPYGPASNARLAAAAARLQPGAQEEVVLGMRRVRMYMNWGKIQAEEDSEQGMSSWLGFSRVAVQQGVGNLPAEEEEELQQEVGQIVVVVHGIGEMLNQRWGAGMVQDLGVLRRTLQQQQLQVAREAPKTEVLGCEWWQSIHSEEMDKRLASITLPSLAAVRDFANLSLVDGLAFTQERERIITTTAANLETAVSRFKDCHPNFRGQIFLLGHSLGGVILWDILTQQRLAFTPNALFTVGSPIGVFLHAAGSINGPRLLEKLGKVPFFNIFHPLDPVAYRVEPLLAPHLAQLPPASMDVDMTGRLDWQLPCSQLGSATELLQVGYIRSSQQL
ncbi:unnamed protein product [Effrenium voratum]|nr:unnamed protein product [Effrenium voratum]